MPSLPKKSLGYLNCKVTHTCLRPDFRLPLPEKRGIDLHGGHTRSRLDPRACPPGIAEGIGGIIFSRVGTYWCPPHVKKGTVDALRDLLHHHPRAALLLPPGGEGFGGEAAKSRYKDNAPSRAGT